VRNFICHFSSLLLIHIKLFPDEDAICLRQVEKYFISFKENKNLLHYFIATKQDFKNHCDLGA
tara:strand:- start:201 stop:389 length:189 start_codon:yes stop_codon:yes gene_type:complete